MYINSIIQHYYALDLGEVSDWDLMRKSATGHELSLDTSILTPADFKTALKSFLEDKIEKIPKIEDHFYDDYEYGDYYQIY